MGGKAKKASKEKRLGRGRKMGAGKPPHALNEIPMPNTYWNVHNRALRGLR